MGLESEIKKLRESAVSKAVDSKLNEFMENSEKGGDEWFSELCFCILTANSKAATAISVQQELGCNGFLHMGRKTLSAAIKRNKHRFHNIKACYITGARKFSRIKEILANEKEPREWLVKNVKGIGWKESSHFLRNVGYFDYALLDRHILRLMLEYNLIKEIPPLSKKNYLEIENKLKKLADKLNMSLAELDLYMWYMKTGKVLK